MQLIDQADLAHVMGGAGFTLSVSVNVPAADVSVISELLVNMLTGTLDANSFAQMLTTSAANFNDMKIEAIDIFNFA